MISNTNRLILSLLVISFVCSAEVSRGQTVMQKLKANSQTSHFAQALESANLNVDLNKSGPYTLFAPSNDAFDKLTASQKQNSNLLLNHIFTGMATERSLRAMSNVTCLSGKSIILKKGKNGHSLSVGSYAIVTSNIKADNGVIHVINGVIQ